MIENLDKNYPPPIVNLLVFRNPVSLSVKRENYILRVFIS